MAPLPKIRSCRHLVSTFSCYKNISGKNLRVRHYLLNPSAKSANEPRLEFSGYAELVM